MSERGVRDTMTELLQTWTASRKAVLSGPRYNETGLAGRKSKTAPSKDILCATFAMGQWTSLDQPTSTIFKSLEKAAMVFFKSDKQGIELLRCATHRISSIR